MHYEDKEASKAGKLVIVVYKHEILGTDNFDYDICSIQHCEYVHPRFITKLYKHKDEVLGQILKDVKAEEWYLLKITKMGRPSSKASTFNCSKPKNVSNTRNDLHRLH